jgi:LuxR family transcriptional regulator, quorum-sensing system regulator LasR
MSLLERFHTLMELDTEDAWCRELFGIGKELGFDYSLLAIVPKPGMKLENAFLRSNYATDWRSNYDQLNLAYVDPTVAHCVSRTTSLVWSPDIFRNLAQKQMYEEACRFGLRSGVTLPIHGPKGELGILCFVNDQQPGKQFQRDLAEQLPALSLLRDVVFDTGIDFALPEVAVQQIPTLTRRELECLQWTAAGKTTWEIAKILHCSEPTANFHIANFRRKLDVGSRREAVLKAIRLGIIALP